MDDDRALDQAAIDAVLRGDNRAFDGLLRRHQKMVAGVVWRFGVRSPDVEDLVSEVFIKTYRNLHLYRPEHPFSTWLYRLATNHVLDHLRKTRRERGRVEMPLQIADDAPGPARGVVREERANVLREALSELSDRYREVLTLVYLEGLKIDEVARVLSLPHGTIKTRLMRGRNALKKILVRRHPEHFKGAR